MGRWNAGIERPRDVEGSRLTTTSLSMMPFWNVGRMCALPVCTAKGALCRCGGSQPGCARFAANHDAPRRDRASPPRCSRRRSRSRQKARSGGHCRHDLSGDRLALDDAATVERGSMTKSPWKPAASA